jgi:hypothetical protein
MADFLDLPHFLSEAAALRGENRGTIAVSPVDATAESRFYWHF